jgi:transposase
MSDEDLIPMLLGSFEEHTSWETKILTKFLSMEDDEAVAQDTEAWAWVDDRGIPYGRTRDYRCSFNAENLCEVLKQLVGSRYSVQTLY